jgi:hypothetical protein
MIRALSSLCVLAVLSSGSAMADKKKEKIGILGLEVYQASGNVDAAGTQVASALTVQLRLQPKAGKGPFAWQNGSERELLDEKVMSGCNNEDNSCMAKIGEKLGVDRLLYGRIERKSQAGSTGYQISLRLLKVSDLQFTTWTDFIPLADTQQDTKLNEWARRGYKRLTGENDGGTLVVTVKNVDRGTILIEGEERGNISSGKGEVPGLAEGKYKVSVVSPGYQRWDSDEPIQIKGGDVTSKEITLKELKRGGDKLCDPAVSTCENTGSDEPKTGVWKGIMIAGIVVAAGGGGFAGYNFVQKKKYESGGSCSTVGSCGNNTAAERDSDGNSYATKANIGWGTVALGGGMILVGVIKGYIATGAKEKQAAGTPTVGQRARKRGGFTVTPVVTSEAAGATLRLDW